MKRYIIILFSLLMTLIALLSLSYAVLALSDGELINKTVPLFFLIVGVVCCLISWFNWKLLD